MADDRPNISAPRLDAGEVARRAFGTVRRGFDPQEVRAYLEQLAGALDQAARRERELRQELEDAEERARHPVIDESVLTSSLGQRSAAVLRGAHEEAARILSQAEEAAAAMVRDAQQQATDIQVNAESSSAERIAEAELEANSLRHQAREQAAAAIEVARAEGESLVERAREHGRSMLDQAQEARRRVLADMAHRRRLITEQIELFRSARDEIAGSVVGVRRSLDRIVEDLSHAEDSARAAASGAARPRGIDVPEAVLVEEGERAAAELGDLRGDGHLATHATHAPPPEADDVAPAPPREPGPSEVESRGSRSVLRFDDIATVVDPGPLSAVESPESTQGSLAATARTGTTAPRSAPELHDWEQDLPPIAAEDPIAASPAPEDAVVEHPQPVGPAGDPVTGGADVDGLFARLRARHVTEEPDDEPGTATPPGAVEADPASADPAAGAALADTDEDDEAGAAGAAGERAEVPPGLEGDGEARGEESGEAGNDAETVAVDEVVADDEEPSADAEMFNRRAEVLDPVTTTLARRLKRALQDDQNRLLDRLRQGTGEWSEDLLVDEVSQRDLYAKAASTSVRDAMAAGADFARSLIGGRRPKSAEPDAQARDALCTELAGTVVTLIRRRLETGDVPDAAERIGAAYREWRGERIERLAEDVSIEAFSKGVLAGAGKRSVRWSRSEVGPGCADCEDNGLGGAVVAGEEFPTGHRHPPAHAGCRCLVLPTPS